MCYFVCLYFFGHAGAVVYPSPTFSADTMLSALQLEQCTHTFLVPTTLRALLDVLPEEKKSLKINLRDVCVAGSPVSKENILQTVRQLGSSGVSTGFGMTEGSPIWTARVEDPELLIANDSTISGSAAPGARIKICAPGSVTPVEYGIEGEIHQSGPGVIRAYLGSSDDQKGFYRDDRGRTWFVTGDQAVMRSDGKVVVTGRYKDMIIRGGENISPASIEAVLNRLPGIEVSTS